MHDPKNNPTKAQVDFSNFNSLDIRLGTILEAAPFPEARKPAYKLKVDFGEIGVLNSSAQITVNYSPEALIGKRVMGVVNFAPRQIGPFMSECLILGVYGQNGAVSLISPDHELPNGSLLG